MLRLQNHHKEIAGVLALYGIKPVIEPTNGNHVRFRWKAGPKEQTYVTALTPSDWRSSRNAVAEVRRMLKKAGIEKINPVKSVIEGPKPRPMAPTQGLPVEARLAQLEADVQTLLEMIATLSGPTLVPHDDADDEPREPKKRGRRIDGWIFRAMRYDVFMTVSEIADAGGRPMHGASVLLTYWKRKGYIEHKRGEGWRKKPNVEQLKFKDDMNGHPINGSATH